MVRNMATQPKRKLPEEPVGRYVIIAAILIIVLMTVATVWELYFAGNTSVADKIAGIIQWTGPATATTAMIITVMEAHGVVTRKKYLDRGKEEGRQEVQKKWGEWNKRREEVISRGEEFTEPHPTTE